MTKSQGRERDAQEQAVGEQSVCNMSGRLEVITGPMFSGKTEELIRRLRRAKIAGRSVLALKPSIDTRNGTAIKSHSGVEIESKTFDPSFQTGYVIVDKYYDVIGLDEIQFLHDPFGTAAWLSEQRRKGSVVIAAGLDMTFRCQPFGSVPYLLAIADKIDKLTAVCHKCGEEATLTQRLVDGKPASFEGDTIVIGGLDTYEARCRECFEVG